MIEDAPAGVRAGRAAGMTVWAVTTTHTEDELEAADRTAADLAALLEPLGLLAADELRLGGGEGAARTPPSVTRRHSERPPVPSTAAAAAPYPGR